MMRRLLPGLVAVAVMAGCGTGRRTSSYDPYYDRGSGPYYRSDPYVIERHQDAERERLNARQQAERERLLREQGRERRSLKNQGEWDRQDRRDQALERQRQERRFERQRRGLGEHQEDERDRYRW